MGGAVNKAANVWSSSINTFLKPAAGAFGKVVRPVTSMLGEDVIKPIMGGMFGSGEQAPEMESAPSTVAANPTDVGSVNNTAAEEEKRRKLAALQQGLAGTISKNQTSSKATISNATASGTKTKLGQ